MTILPLTGTIKSQTFGAPLPQASLVNALIAGVVSAQALNTPKLDSTPVDGAPAIGACMDIVSPGDAISLCGDNLFGAEFLAWAGDKVFRIPSVRTWSDAAQLKFPTSGFEVTSQSIQTLPHSAMWLWPKGVNGFGRPVKINGPEIYRTWPECHYVGRSREIRLIGKNLSIVSGSVRVVAKRGADAVVDLPIVSASKYEVVANLPIGFAAGDWSIQLYNGTGGEYFWSNQVTLTIGSALPTSATEFSVAAQPGSTDTARLLNAITAASAVPGSTVVIPAGTYDWSGVAGPGALSFSQGILFPSWGSNATLIHLRGAGVGLTRVRKAAGAGNAQGLWLYLTAEGSTVSDITFEDVSIFACSRGQVVTRCNFEEWNAISIYPVFGGVGAVSFDKVCNLDVTNCKFDAYGGGPNVNLGRGSGVRFANSEFIGHYIDGQKDKLGANTGQNHQNNGISTYGTRRLLMENNFFHSHDAVNNEVLTRSFAANWSADKGHYFKGNTSVGNGAFAAISADENTGEEFLLHGDVAFGIVAAVVSSTETTTTVTFNAATFASKGWGLDTTTTAEVIATKTLSMFVTSGASKGQYKSITAYVANDANTLTFTHGSYVNLQPSAGDSVSIRPAFTEMIFVGNSIDKSPIPTFADYTFNRSGFYCLDSCPGVIIDGNSIENTLYGCVFNSGGGDSWVQVGAYVANNTIENLHRWFPASYTAGFADTSLGFTAGDRLWSCLHAVRNNLVSDSDTGFVIGTGETVTGTGLYNGHALHVFQGNTAANIDFPPSPENHSFYMVKAVNRILMTGNSVENEPALQQLDASKNHDLLYL